MIDKHFTPRLERPYNNVVGGALEFLAPKKAVNKTADTKTNASLPRRISTDLVSDSIRSNLPAISSKSQSSKLNTGSLQPDILDLSASINPKNLSGIKFNSELNFETSYKSYKNISLKRQSIAFPSPSEDNEYSIKLQLLSAFLPKTEKAFSFKNFNLASKDNRFDVYKAEKIDYSKTEIKSFSSKFDFSLNGTFETKDGKKLEFSLNMNFESSFTSISKEAFSAKFEEGLKNSYSYNGSSTEISNRKFSFSFDFSLSMVDAVETGTAKGFLDIGSLDNDSLKDLNTDLKL